MSQSKNIYRLKKVPNTDQSKIRPIWHLLKTARHAGKLKNVTQMRRKSSPLKLIRTNKDDRASRQRTENNYYNRIPYAQEERCVIGFDKYGYGKHI